MRVRHDTCVKCPDYDHSAGKKENGKVVVKEQRHNLECSGLMCMCTLRISARIARPGEEASPHHTTVIEEANPHHEEATTVLEDASRQQILTRTVQQHVAIYNNNNCRLPCQTKKGPSARPVELPKS